MKLNRSRQPQTRGSSLIEILVVLVIFTVGILAIVQIFPGGLNVLRQNNIRTSVNALVRAEVERLKNEQDSLPGGVYPDDYINLGTAREIIYKLDRLQNDFTPLADGLTQNGILTTGADGLGEWALYSGANTVRRIVDEGRKVPAPRFVQSLSGTRFGGVMNLQFAPVFLDAVLYNDGDATGEPSSNVPFIVYGNDLSKNITEDPVTAFPVRQDYQVFVDEDGQEMALPQGPHRPFEVGYSRTYRVSARVQFTQAGNPIAQDLVRLVRLPSASAGARPFYSPGALSTLFAVPGRTFVRVEPDTLAVARVFDDRTATTFTPEADYLNSPEIAADVAYQFARLNDSMGVLMFHPKGSQIVERRGNGRFPLRARVDYSVLDWRNIRDDFRVPTGLPFERKLVLDSIKVRNNRYADNRVYQGIGVQVPTGTGPTTNTDFLLIDRETGAIFMPDSYKVDKSLGIISFIDVDNNAANGLSANVVYPGDTATSRVNDVRNRSVRGIYQARNEISIQLLKASSNYRVTYSSTLGIAQCYVPAPGFVNPNAVTSRIYFPLMDIGRKVVIGEAVYLDAGGNVQTLTEQEFVIRAPRTGLDWGAMAYVDLREKDPNAVTITDAPRGYAVRNVRGASITVRATWNPSSLSLGPDSDQNLTRLGQYLSNTRTISTESFLMKGATP